MEYYQSLSDNQFISEFEQCTLPGEAFSHEAHTRLAVLYFKLYGFSEGLQKVTWGIKKYAESLGAPDKYHATMTYAAYRVVVEALRGHSFNCWDDVKSLLSAFIENGQACIRIYYSDQLLSSAAAKRSRVLPDLRAFQSDSIFGLKPFEWVEGNQPVLISMPHNGTCIPEDIADSMNPVALKVADTDWHLRQLYDFAVDAGYYIISPLYSRYVIDLNRDTSGKSLYPGSNTTELCPTTQFDLSPIYKSGREPNEDEINKRVERYWQPYHQQLTAALANIKDRFGKALLFEAHSIAQVVPRFFEGQLPDFNFGTNNGVTCSNNLLKVLQAFDTKCFSKVIDGRFKGGYITRHYADQMSNIHTIQLELSQSTYLNKSDFDYNLEKANLVQPVLKSLLEQLKQVL